MWRGYYARKYKEKLMLDLFMKKCAVIIQVYLIYISVQ